MKFWDKDDPFTLARVRLTGWYVVILISLIGFFTYLTFEAKESAYVRVYTVVKNSQDGENRLVELQDTYQEYNRRFKERVLIFDLGLTLVGGALAWWLSGKTLKPIRLMVKEQQAFAQDLSHGLKTPITSMKLLIEAFERGHKQLPAGQVSLLRALQYELGHMQAVVGGVLTLTRVKHQAQIPQPIALEKLIEKLLASMEPIALSKEIQLSREMGSKTLTLWANEDQVWQALMTILDNAIKYTPREGKVEVKTKCFTNFGVIMITDNGPGIAKTDKQKIFEKYYRGREKKRSMGTGLGLAIAKRLIEANRGEILVRDRRGGGTVFTVQLPLYKG